MQLLFLLGNRRVNLQGQKGESGALLTWCPSCPLLVMLLKEPTLLLVVFLLIFKEGLFFHFMSLARHSSVCVLAFQIL